LPGGPGTIIDQNPWEVCDLGLRIPAAGEFRGVVWEGHIYDVAIGSGKTTPKRDSNFASRRTERLWCGNMNWGIPAFIYP
jgi:hypothetical protein